jgi:ribosomal protection tetracycline resistance protein
LLRRTLNLGIVAHVDAGKTTLTERLLYAAGVVDEPGSVDAGTTQTDSLALEQQRGITIKSAVVSFAIDDVTVNLIDTPGHPDFIAEVERSLSVLDGAVLVISAVEGVQPQTRILMRALQRLRIPTIVFVNKLDRTGADDERVLREISARLTPAIVPLGSVRGLGARAADFVPWGADDAVLASTLGAALAENDDELLAALVDDDSSVPYSRLRAGLVDQTGRALVQPVFFGSALTGAGVDALMAGIAELLPAAAGDPDGPVSGTVFKIERGAAGEKVAYVRMISGTVRTRDRLSFGPELEGKVTAIHVFDGGPAEQQAAVSAGEIGKLWGLNDVQIGDRIGRAGTDATAHEFAPPTLEAVVVSRNPDDGGALRVALDQLAEQDPLIDVRQDDSPREISVSLYGEVQKEVIQATLADDFGLDVDFRETTIICVERPVRTGDAVEILQAVTHPFSATVGLRVDPGPIGSGVRFRLDVDPRLVPLYIYKTVERFSDAMTQYVRRTLREGLFGWQVTDCVVTMTECGYYIGDGPGKPTGSTPRATAADFRKLTPLVLMEALVRARTVVCEPVLRLSLELPTETVGAALSALARLGAGAPAPTLNGELATIETVLSAARVRDLQRQLPALTGGEGVLESDFDGYRRVSGALPTRPRSAVSPLDREAYLRSVARGGG